MRMVMLGALVALTACSGDDEPAGDPAVHERIEAETDCDSLQAEFDRAAANNETAEAGSEEAEWTVDYMDAANDRMQELGC